jgi:hypothetical protein
MAILFSIQVEINVFTLRILIILLAKLDLSVITMKMKAGFNYPQIQMLQAIFVIKYLNGVPNKLADTV